MMYVDPIVEYLCPACGNPYFGSGIASYSVFHVIGFSDGSSYGNFPRRPHLTRCPRCRRIFAIEHLFKIPMTRRVAQFIRYDRQSEYDGKKPRTEENDRGRQELYGRVDATLRGGESAIDFLEEAIAKGLYFPAMVSEHKKKELNILLRKLLWWNYNQQRDEIDAEKYSALCRDLIDRLISIERFDDRELILAELYRNIGCFEDSRRYLEAVPKEERTQPYVDCISKQIELGNTDTVAINRPDGRSR